MFRNYLTTALRNLSRQKIFTPLNVIGLSIGLASFVMIYMFISFELSFDKYHEKADRIYKVIKQDPGNFYMGTNIFRVTPVPLAESLVKEYPEVVSATKLSSRRTFLIRTDKDVYYDSGWHYADKHVFDVFTFPLLQGNPETALEDPYTVVLSETYARKYYGDENPVGKVLNINNEYDFTITGVMNDIPENSHFTANFFGSFESLRDQGINFERFSNNSQHTYFVMVDDRDHRELEAKLPAFIDKYAGDNIWSHHGQKSKYLIEPLTDIHLKSRGTFGIRPQSDIKYIYLFVAIAFVILLIACINYMNLATVQSIRRGREVGIRKVVGAFRHQLIRQFIGESLLLTVISFILSCGLVYLFKPLFTKLVQKDIPFTFFTDVSFVVPLLGVVLLVGLLSGWYPALMASSIKPVTMLKGIYAKSKKGLMIRNSMVVIQFSISIVLIISTLIVTDQLNYIRDKKLGYDRDHVISFRLRGDTMTQNKEIVSSKVMNLASVKKVAFATHSPVRIGSSSLAHFEGRTDDQDKLPTYQSRIDENFIDLFEIEIIAGRNFSKEFSGDSIEYIINETTANKLGWDDPVGKVFGFGRRIGAVVGVMKDFHFTSLHLPIMPLALNNRDSNRNIMFIKISPDNVQHTINEIETIWNEFNDGYPFSFTFLDEAYDNMYQSEIRLGTIFRYFAMLAILICSLGLFGLASFTAQQSTKEIGIRKVLGAGEGDIAGMLSWKFAKWVIAANIIAWPAGYYAMSIWLENFEYRISPGIGSFILAGLSALFIAGITISFQTLKAARSNPVKALRYE